MSGRLVSLAALTLQRPREAARQILALDLPRPLIWQGFLLAVILNALLFSAMQYLAGSAGGTPPGLVPTSLQSPLVAALILGGVLLVSVHVLYWVGRMADGEASLDGLLVLVTWLQLLRFVAQLLVLFLLMVMPVLAALVVLAVLVWGAWILVSFIDEAHGFNSMAKAAFVIVGAVVALFVGLVLMVSVLSVLALGA